jgi:peptide/nickel transport system substrate-binding protein
LVAAIMGDPRDVGPEAGPVSGVDAMRGLMHAGLASPDERIVMRAQLAESVPSLENGLWKVFPDGRMETTWKIMSHVRWHDGTPFTSADVVFTAEVAQDRELPGFRNPAYQSVESVEALNPLTVLVRWKQPFIDADGIFASPLPRHILETPAREAKATFTQLPYWSREFVGAGAFKLREWVPGSHMLLDANDVYPLGRPRIDEIEIKLIPNDNTLMANVLSGVVELPLGRTLSLEQALDMRTRWQSGRIEIVPRPGWSVVYPQLTYSNPLVIKDVQFRRALLHAIDRQQLVDTLMFGYSTVAHSILPPGRPDYEDIKGRAPVFGFDPRTAGRMIEELGYTKGADGGFRDAAGQRLEVEMRTSAENDNNVKLIYPVADYWQRVGIGVDVTLVPPQARDREFRATFPGFQVVRHPSDVTRLQYFHSSRAPTRENNWTGGSDTAYQSPTYDALFDRYSQTIPLPERFDLLGQVVHHLADQVVVMGLYYDNMHALIGNRVANVVVPLEYGTPYTWSAYRWEMRS